MLYGVCRYPRKLALVLLAVTTVIFGIVGMFPRHEPTNASSLVGQFSCASHCLSHAQPVTNTGPVDDLKKDDHEPSPPDYSWLQTPESILLLYVVTAILAFWLLEERKRILLTIQLRI